MNAIKLSMVAWMEQQGRLIALSGIPYLPRTASLTALAMKRREWKLKVTLLLYSLASLMFAWIVSCLCMTTDVDRALHAIHEL